MTRSSLLRSISAAAGRLASWKTSLALAAILAVVMARTTYLEAACGKEYVQWYVYSSSWFITLLALLGANLILAIIIRFPWKRSQLGLVVAHVGLLVLLVGWVQTFRGAVEGRMELESGQTANAIRLNHTSQFTAQWHGRSDQPSTAFTFRAGPVDWPQGKTLDLGQLGDVGLKVLKFYRRAQPETAWVEDTSGGDGVALQLALAGPDGKPLAENWIAANRFGAEQAVGPMRFTLLPIPTDSMLEDFLHPPEFEPHAQPANRMLQELLQRRPVLQSVARELPDLIKSTPVGAGLLAVHCQGRRYPLPVADNLGKRVPIGDSGVEVEIVSYLPNARPQGGGKFVTAGEKPKNPVLELLIHLPEREEPLRQVTFAKHPLLNLNAARQVQCPVEFWYHHPTTASWSGTDFLQTPGGELYCRVTTGGQHISRGQVEPGAPIEAAAGFQVTVLKYVPHARREFRFVPVAENSDTPGDAAALIEVTAAGLTRKLWLAQGDRVYDMQTILTSEGALSVCFENARHPLDFAVKLLDVHPGQTPGKTPGQTNNASCSSSIQLSDQADRPLEISTNSPVSLGKFTFEQSSYRESPTGKPTSVLNVAYDPGVPLKYAGGLTLCLGALLMLLTKAFAWSRNLRRRSKLASADHDARLPKAA